MNPQLTASMRTPLNYQVKLKRHFGHDVQDLDDWCMSHVGGRWRMWDRGICHMDYEHHAYTWRYEFLNAESAAQFALTHG
jgi:hypothetical protein